MRPSCTSGQAAVEYLAVVALVVALFVVAGLALDGRAVAAATVGQIRRGLCIVEGHDCSEVHPPCSLSSRRSGSDLDVDVVVVHLGGGSSAIVERKSDGKVYVTVANHLDAGATGGFGASLKLGDRIALGGEARASALASLGRGATYEVADERQAVALIRLLHRPKVDPSFYSPAVRAYWRRVEAVLPRVPAPVSRYVDAGLIGSASLGPLTGELVLGGREDLVTGSRTVYLKGSVSLDAGVEGASASGSARGQVAVTLDRHGKPVDLMVLGAGELHASWDLPALLSPVAGHLRTGGGRKWEVEAHLDLTQPGRAAAVLASLSNPSRLAGMVLADGVVEARGYGRTDGGFELSGRVEAGIALGGGVAHTTESMRLLSAIEHTPEGFWVPRYDCLAAA
jgi:hypothetical protein